MATLNKSPRHNLAAHLTPMIGREGQVEHLLGLLDTTRLLTLTGSGGVGKTRLALELGRRLLPTLRDGVWFVDLAPVTDPTLLARAVVSMFKQPVLGRRTPQESLVAYLETRELLLILDNCEHLIEACAQLTEQLLNACPDLRILATSREHLRSAGEVAWRVPSLTRPRLSLQSPTLAATPSWSVPELLTFEAVRLFTARVQMVDPDFVLNAENAPAVAHICNQLDGIPLALEMTAAWATSMTVQEMAERLAGAFDHRFALLASGARTAPPRHRTLRAAFEWGYSLLNPAEQRLLAQVSVFSGGWTAEAAEYVARTDGDSPARERSATPGFLSLLAELVNKSLIIADRHAGHTRYRMLETIRQFAAEKLHELDEIQERRSRHLTYFVAVATQTRLIMLAGPPLQEQLAKLDPEIENLRGALTWAQETGRIEAFAQIAAALWPYWRERGAYREGRTWLNAAQAQCHELPPNTQASVQVGLAALLFNMDASLMISVAEQALAQSRLAGDPIHLAWSNTLLGAAHWRRQDFTTAQGYLEAGLVLARAVDSPDAVRLALVCLGNILLNQGQHALGTARLLDAVALAWKWQEPAYLVWALRELAYLDVEQAKSACERELGRQRMGRDAAGLTQTLQCYGRLLLENAEYRRAQECLSEATTLWRTLEFQWCAHGSLALTLFDLALAAWHNNDHDVALESFTESLTLFRQVDDTTMSFHVHLQYGYFCLVAGNPQQACIQFLESLHRLEVSGWTTRAAMVLAGLAAVAQAQQHRLAAARLYGAAARLSNNSDLAAIRSERIGFDHLLAAARSQLTDPAAVAAWQEGATWTWEAAADYAVAAITPWPALETAPTAAAQVAPVQPRPALVLGLTVREVEVLRLVADGLTDSQIAQQLVISPRTVNTHLSSIFRKLDVSSRTAAVRMAHERALF